MKTSTLLKQTVAFLFISTVVTINPGKSQAITVQEITNPRQQYGGWVTDKANILSDETETEINRLISELEQNNGAEIAVVTVPDTETYATPKAFATELFNYWEVGKADVDNGVLFLISIRDRRVEIETGKGLQQILPDTKVKNIIDTQITPQYKQGNYDRGTLNGTKALISALDSTSNSGIKWLLLPVIGGIGFALIKGFIEWRRGGNKVYVSPYKNKIDLQRSDNRSICCTKCKKPMQRERNITLTKAQTIAQKLGGVSYRGYKCSSCSNEENPYVTLSYLSDSSRYQDCPNCQELTVMRQEKTVKKATKKSQGKRLITKKCHCCDYQTERIISTPRLPAYSRSSNSNRRYNNYHNTYVDSSYSGGSYGGGSSSSSDFGGGSSDGGGAGGDW